MHLSKRPKVRSHFSTMAMHRICLATLLVLVTHAQAVGLKRRLAEAAETSVPPVVAAPTSSREPHGRGGIRQRLGSSDQPVLDSITPLNTYLKEQWAKGSLNTGQVQQIALRSTQQGARGLERMGAMGAEGAHTNNLFRALKNILGTPLGAPEFHWAEIPLKSGRRMPHPFLLPHEFFACYQRDCERKWASTIRGPEGAAKEFWTALQHNDFVSKHPALPRESWAKTIPLGLHGDGGAFSNNDNLYVISWNSLLGSGTTIQKRFVCTLVRKSEMTAETLDAIFSIMAWSFNLLLFGRTPATDYNGLHLLGGGLPLAGGYKAALCQIRGDWAFYTEVFKFPTWNGALSMCWMCRASSTLKPLLFTDFSADAGWRRTRWTHEGYVQYIRHGSTSVVIFCSLVLYNGCEWCSCKMTSKALRPLLSDFASQGGRLTVGVYHG